MTLDRRRSSKPDSQVSFGELVSAAFDEAMALTRDPRRAARMAAELVSEILMTNGGEAIARRVATAGR